MYISTVSSAYTAEEPVQQTACKACPLWPLLVHDFFINSKNNSA